MDYTIPLIGAAEAGSILSEYLGGRKRRKRLDYLWEEGKSELNAGSHLSPGALNRDVSLAMKNLSPALNTLGRVASKRVGLDSGAAQKEIMGATSSARSNILARLIEQGKQLDAQQKARAMAFLNNIAMQT